MKYSRTPEARLRLFAAACAAAGLLVASCVTVPSGGSGRADALAARVDAVLARRGLGPGALSVIENVIRHDAAPPPATPVIVPELLAQPLAVADAGTLFYRTVPGALRRMVDEVAAETQTPGVPGKAPASLRDVLDAYLGELAEAQRVLRSAARGARIDAQAIILQLRDNLPAANRLRDIAASLDQAALDRATTLYLNATARFVRGLQAEGDVSSFPTRSSDSSRPSAPS